MNARKVVIIGGGIGGLTLASALHARNINVEVFERTAQLSEIGAGVQMTPNAMKVLSDLGAAPAVIEAGFLPEATVARDWRTGKIVFRTQLKGDCERLYAAPYVHVLRADLQRCIRETLPENLITLSSDCVDIRNEGKTAIATFADGREVEADLIVAADGIRSIARQRLFENSAPQFTKNVCWRAVVPFDAPDYDLVGPYNSIWFGPNGHIVTYYVKGGKAVNMIACLECEEWAEESWNTRSSAEALAAAYPGWNQKLQTLFSRANDVYKWGLFDRDPMSTWTNGRVALLGDAAHPMLPYLSQGAAMAMEDGIVLARMLADNPSDVDAALVGYEALRIPRASRVQLASREQGKKNHLTSPWARLRRDLAYRIASLGKPQNAGLKSGWVYGYDAVTAESAQSAESTQSAQSAPAAPPMPSAIK